ncbi:MAG TPA: hypothetical protein ENK17_01555, partial [Anaerolineae bacterium]|nr:hypothetical protein [Anaerolineae bacterium]
RFYADSDDGVRVWVDDALIVDGWQDQSRPNTRTGDVILSARQHTVTVEYYEHGGGASVHVWWQPLDDYALWDGEYFANRQFEGSPVMVRGDAAIDFDWGTGPPVSWMPDDDFAVRWTREVVFPAGCYRFAVQADDGVRFWLDQSLLIDKWEDMDYELHHIGTCLQGAHTLRLEYYEHTGSARVRFWWGLDPGDNLPPAYPGLSGGAATTSTSSTGGTTAATSSTSTAPAVDPWQAAYFDNPDLRGEPVMTREETRLSHDWGWGSPGAALPPDGFSARWEQPIAFERGMYRFVTVSDDGVRLWVDGRLLIDAWQPMRGQRQKVVWLSAGEHVVRLEYYEESGAVQVRLTWQRLPGKK